uniref:Uncharacterized protein n=1 Tax=Rhodnius prolixus TaxID=13249 RepID=T1HDX2_RHOPR
MGIDFINNSSTPSRPLLPSFSSSSSLKAKQTKSVDSSAYVKGDKQQPSPPPPPPPPPPPLSIRTYMPVKDIISGVQYKPYVFRQELISKSFYKIVEIDTQSTRVQG